MFGFAKQGELLRIEENVKSSFSTVKQDVANLSQWVTYLHGQNQQLQQALDENVRALQHVPTAETLRQEVRRALEGSQEFEQLRERIRHVEHRADQSARMEQKVHVLEEAQRDWFTELRKLQSQVAEAGNLRRQAVIPRMVPETVPGTSRLQEKVIRLAARGSKDAITQSILKLIRMHGRITGVALRESIVHEQGLCSKSTFYRILEELEDTDDITVVDEGKEKVYLWGGIRAKKARTEE